MSALLRATRCAALRAPRLAAPATALQMAAPAIAASPVLRLSRNMGAGAGSGGAGLEIEYVKKSWGTVVTNVKGLTGNSEASNKEIFETAGQVLFEKILEADDTATFEAKCDMFKFKYDFDARVKDPHYKTHVAGVVETVNTAIDNLHDLDGLKEVLFNLGKKHNNYGVKNSHYELVRDSLVYTLDVALGGGKPGGLTDKDAEQWLLVWGFVESNMKEGQASDASYSLEG